MYSIFKAKAVTLKDHASIFQKNTAKLKKGPECSDSGGKMRNVSKSWGFFLSIPQYSP